MHHPESQPRASAFYHYEVHPEHRPSQPSAPVVVAGAGPIGLATALDVARFGVPCVVLAEERQVTHGSRAGVLTRRSVEILQQLGVVEPFLEKGLPWHQGRSFYREQEVYRMIMPHDPDDRFLPALNLQQQYIEEFLVDACERNPLIEVCWGQKVVGITNTDAGAKLRVDSSTGEYDLDAQWVVAADGGRSTLRKLLNQRMEGRAYAGRFVISDIKASINLPTERLCFYDPPWNPGSNALVHRLPDGVWRIDLKLPDGESPEEALENARLASRINAVLSMIRQPVSWELDWAAVYSANTLTLPDYVVGRVLFTGDAAHLLPIFGVRGMNTGLQDSNNLAWKLAFVVRGWAPPDLLKTYSAERVTAAREICAEAGRSTRFMAPQSDGSRLLRDAVLSFSLSEDFPKDLMHWRTSRPHAYVDSVLNSFPEADQAFEGGVGCGEAVRNVCIEDDVYFLDRVGARPGFHLFAFAGDEPASAELLELLDAFSAGPVPVVRVLITGHPAHRDESHAEVVVADRDFKVHAKYAARPGTMYLVRPDLHVCARWLRATTGDVRRGLAQAIVGVAHAETLAAAADTDAATPAASRDREPMLEKRMSVGDLEQVYDVLADAIEDSGSKSELYLAKLALALANLVGDRTEVERAIRASLRDLPPRT